MSFKIESSQNRYLAPGHIRVEGVVTLTAQASPSSSKLALGFVIDKSSSMGGDRIEAVRVAITNAIQKLDERATFFVVAFNNAAEIVVKDMQATPANKREAIKAVNALQASGGTTISQGLAATRLIFSRYPDAIRHAIFLTDGRSELEERASAISDELRRCEGLFECNCYGFGTDWKIGEVQEIARTLLGRVALLPNNQALPQAFQSEVERLNTKALKDVKLRLWIPQGTKLLFVKQVSPTIEDLTDKAKLISAFLREYMTGSWGATESRSFHIGLEVKVGSVGDDMIAARPSVVYQELSPAGWLETEDKSPEARLFATWTQDEALSSRIDSKVAYYSGQGELAKVIEQGLEAREKGQEVLAAQFLGRAVKIANDSQNKEIAQRLDQIVDVVDAKGGTVRLKSNVQKSAAMELQLESRTVLDPHGWRNKAPDGTGGIK